MPYVSAADMGLTMNLTRELPDTTLPRNGPFIGSSAGGFLPGALIAGSAMAIMMAACLSDE